MHGLHAAVIAIHFLLVSPVFAGTSIGESGFSTQRAEAQPADGAACALARQEDRSVLYSFEKSFWIPDGSRGDRHIYVIYAPWCGPCKELARNRSALGDEVQLRWIPASESTLSQSDMDHMSKLVVARDPRMIGGLASFKSNASMDKDKARRVIKSGNSLFRAVRAMYRKQGQDDKRLGYPTMLYVDRNGAVVIRTGVPSSSELKKIAADVASQSSLEDDGYGLAGLRHEETGKSSPKEEVFEGRANAQKWPVTDFLFMGGGQSPSNTEVALEKNILYAQRTMNALGLKGSRASIYFASGERSSKDVKYLEGNEYRFKSHSIPNVLGSSTPKSLNSWLGAREGRASFFYFTGHGGKGGFARPSENYMAMWDGSALDVKQFSKALDASGVPMVALMVQCYAGGFANFIYKEGDPNKEVAKTARCGFFATVYDKPSVGCTSELYEADYQDYSTSFFAGLSGRSRTGSALTDSVDYDGDGRVSYAEAHAFAKVDDLSSDVPVSTSEVWLHRQAESRGGKRSGALSAELLSQPINETLKTARPEQAMVVDQIINRLKSDVGVDIDKDRWMSPGEWRAYENALDEHWSRAYIKRLEIELVSIGMEKRIRSEVERNPKALAILDNLLACEQGSWTPIEQAPVQSQQQISACGGMTDEGVSEHNIATAAGNDWTSKMRELFNKAGMDLADRANVVYVKGHAESHSSDYHHAVYQKLSVAMSGCRNQDACHQLLRGALRDLAQQICKPNTSLNGLVRQ